MIKFEKKKYVSLEDGKDRVAFSCEGWAVIASHRGVMIEGTTPWLESPEDFDDLAMLIGHASNEYMRMKPKVVQLKVEGPDGQIS